MILFFRDKTSVFFSLLAVLIILGLYIMFLGDMMEQALEAQLGYTSPQINIAMAGIIMAGMIAVTSITGCMGALEISVDDKKRAALDFLTSPISRSKITLGYILGSAAVGFIMTMLAFGTYLVYIIARGGSLISAVDFARLLFTVLLSVLCGNAMVYFLTLFIKTQNAFTAASTLIGSLIGFIMGIYIPIGQLPNSVGWVIKCFPMSHAASMLRQILVDDTLNELFASAPPESLTSFREMFGVVFVYGDFTSSFGFSAAVLVFTTLVFYVLSLLVIRAK
jgi:multidrug/hemolysin transport system permease protein